MNLQEIDEDAQESPNFSIPTLDSYQKACKHVPDHPLTVKKKKVKKRFASELLAEVYALDKKTSGCLLTYKDYIKMNLHAIELYAAGVKYSDIT